MGTYFYIWPQIQQNGSNKLQVYKRECASGLFKVQPGNRR